MASRRFFNRLSEILLASQADAVYDKDLMLFIVEQNLVGTEKTDAVVGETVPITLYPCRMTRHAGAGPLYENVISSRKPEVHNVSQRCRRGSDHARHKSW